MIRVLYVDDEETLLEIGKIYIERTGKFTVDTAPSAQIGLEKIKGTSYDAVVSDYQMPGMDGIDFLKVLRKHYPALPFIIFTGRGREDVVIQAFEAGADFYLQKGGDPTSQFAELTHKINRAVQHRLDEKALSESEVRFRALIENASDIIRILDREGRIIFDTAVSERMLGYPAGFTVGKSPFEFVHPDDLNMVKRDLQEVYKNTSTGKATEFRIRRADGSYTWVESTGKNLLGVPGIEGVVTTTRFIDERKKAETAIRESEARFRQLFEHSQAVMILIEPDSGAILDANPAAATFYGYTREELSAMRIEDINQLPPAQVADIRKQVLRMEQNYFIFPHRLANGTIRTVEAHSSPIEIGGKPCLFSIIHDITERTQVEEALKKSQIQLTEAMNMAHLANWEFDVVTGTFTFDDRFYTLCGTTAEREGGNFMPADIYVREFVHPDDIPYVTHVIKEVTSVTDPNYSMEMEHRIIRRDGQVRHIIVRFAVITNAAGRVVKTYGANQDITERKRAEQELQNSLTFLNNLIDQSPLSMWVSDEKGTLIRINQACCDTLNISEKDVIGKYNIFEDNLVEEQGFLPLVRDVFLSGRVAHFQLNYDTAQLKSLELERPVSVILDVTIFPVKDTNGKITNAVIQSLNITKRKQVETALRKSEELYRTVVEDQTELICRFTPDDRLTFVNDAYCRYFNLDKDRCLMRPHSIVLPPEDARLMKQHLTSLTLENPVAQIEHRIIMPSGEVRWQRWNDRAIFDKEGHIVEYQSVGRDTTKLKHAEQALQESEARFSTIFEKSPVAICITRIDDGTLIDVNAAVMDMFGYTRGELIGRTTLELNIWGVPLERKKVIGELQESGKIKNLETKFRKKNGETGDLSVSAEIIESFGEQYMLALMQDITDRKRAEAALLESEEKYRNVFDWANEAIMLHPLTTDKQPGRFIEVNDAACRMLGYSREELFSMGPADILPVERQLLIGDMIQQAKVKDAFQFETRLQRKDGTVFAAESNGRLVTFGGRRIWLSLIRDITERKRAENALRESAKQYRTFWDHALELILVQRDGIIQYVNPAVVKTLGYLPEEAFNRPVTDFIAPEYHERFSAAMRRRKSGETVEPYEVEVLGKEGRRRTVIISGSQTEFEGTPSSLIILTDVTGRKALEEAVQQANRKLNLLASITRHDILNQLTALIEYIEISSLYLDDKKTLVAFFEKEMKAATAIERQIRFTEEYQEMGVKVPVWQNVNESIKRAVTGLRMRDIRIGIDRTDLELFADPLFDKVFYNLIDNALRYGGDGMKTIRVFSHESGPVLTIICEDDGAGITEDDKQRLFTKGFGKNTGFGLFLTREILSITGITIAENGIPGRGARFEFTVPKGAYRFTGTG